METKIYKYRNIARIVIEATSPIAIGSGDKDFITDSPVLKDINGLPYIPGTSIAGVIRHAIGDEVAKSFFGYNDRTKSENSTGSNVIFSNALMVGKDGKVLEGIESIDFSDDFYKKFKALPIRQHNSINAKGTVKSTGKFDEQVVYKGCRFCFEIEMVSETEKDNNFELVLKALHSADLRLGGGTRTGFGDIHVVNLQRTELNLSKESDLKAYVNKSSELNDVDFWKDLKVENPEKTNTENMIKYELRLKPDDFFLFGSGFGSDNSDMTPVKESAIVWNDSIPKFENEYVLIPATSVKGALSHRVAFHYNRLTEKYADVLPQEEFKHYVGDNNDAVRELFGASGENNSDKQVRGNVMLSDVHLKKDKFKEKILNHVSIDRFTGGAIDGALFQEEVMYGKDQEFSLLFWVENKVYKEKVIEAFEDTLKDIASGMLPLGGGVNRGHGSFNGVILKNGEPLNK
jgi:CRISPR/Cas system CSM-associated protein Csm3 (group 7 of RAMP superfamily)